jgi:hypothetical protein
VWGNEDTAPSFLTPALVGGEGSAWNPLSPFSRRERPRYALLRKLGRPHSLSGRFDGGKHVYPYRGSHPDRPVRSPSLRVSVFTHRCRGCTFSYPTPRIQRSAIILPPDAVAYDTNRFVKWGSQLINRSTKWRAWSVLRTSSFVIWNPIHTDNVHCWFRVICWAWQQRALQIVCANKRM